MLDPHIPLIEFPDAGAALCYMVECTMATLEHQRDIKRTSKSEIARLERIVAQGLHSCRKFDLAETAAFSRCPRVFDALSKPHAEKT
jgi:hypothetical protein